MNGFFFPRFTNVETMGRAVLWVVGALLAATASAAPPLSDTVSAGTTDGEAPGERRAAARLRRARLLASWRAGLRCRRRCPAPLTCALPSARMRAGCNKEQYREKFGALPTYTLLTAPVKPALQSGFVVAKVRTAGRPGK